jgi:hypothetical protein
MKMKKIIGKCFFMIPLLLALMLTPAFADTLVVDEYRVAETNAYETMPTLGNDGTRDLVVYTLRELLATGFFDAGDIWYQRLLDGEPDGAPVQVTSGATDDKLNDVSGDYIVYTAYDSTSSTTGTIMLYQISTDTSQPLGNAAVIQEPRIHGDKVVWREGSTAATVVMMYDINWLPTSISPVIIAGPIPPTFTVDIGDRFAVWAEYISGQYDVAAYDLSTGTRIAVTSTAATNEREPSTEGAWIVWQAQDHGASPIRIEGLNVDTSEVRVMVDNGARSYIPSVSGDLIGYESDLAGNMDVYVYRISTGESFQVTADPNDQYLNDIFDDQIAYVDRRRAGDEDIYVAQMDFITSLSVDSEAKIIASDGDLLDMFGDSVAAEGDIVAVGAWNHWEGGQGSVYVYHRSETSSGVTWTQEAELWESPREGHGLGWSVAMCGDTMVAGASGQHGFAAVFRRSETSGGVTWTQEAKLNPRDSNTTGYKRFGYSVSIAGDIAVIGASGDDRGGDAYPGAGAAYVFRRSETGGVVRWGQEAKIIPEDAVPASAFGVSVDTDGDIAVIGSLSYSGAAHVFRRTVTSGGVTWTQEAKLIPSDGAYQDWFGRRVSISGDTIVIGAEKHDASGTDSGAAYVFRRSETGGVVSWTQEAKLIPADAGAEAFFGSSVAINEDIMVVGADGMDKVTPPSGGTGSGAAYVFRRTETGGVAAWTQQMKLTASPFEVEDFFGISTAMSGDTVVIGASHADDLGSDAGAAYVFRLLPVADIPTSNHVAASPLDPDTETSPVTVIFSQVTQAGTLSLNISDSGPEAPSGFQLGDPPTYFELTAEDLAYSSPITVCIDYTGISFGGQTPALWHYEDADGDGVYEVQELCPTISIDPVNEIICAEASSLSTFAVFGAEDSEPPITTNVLATPNPVAVDTNITLTATVDDSQTGGSIIDSAECIIDGDIYGNMDAQDEAFDSASEDVIVNIQSFGEAGLHTVCVSGTDSFGNVTKVDDHCAFLPVYDPTGAFVTGGGWIDSLAGAYTADPSLTGKANFGFVSKYKKEADIPTGQTEFQFRVADLNFHSSSYEWLVGKRLCQIQGLGNHQQRGRLQVHALGRR